jgi:hypothetical protein
VFLAEDNEILTTEVEPGERMYGGWMLTYRIWLSRDA